MTGIFLQYNKVHNESLACLAPEMKAKLIWVDLHDLTTGSIDLIPYLTIKQHLESLLPFDFIIVGDVFWQTGQCFCRWAKEHKVPLFFLQHGQWIYIKNKKHLEYYPSHTLLFGDDVAEMAITWPYGKFSKCIVTGSPRYDSNGKTNGGSYIYFSPPVLSEIINHKPKPLQQHTYRALQVLKGIDKKLPIVIQPHYREYHIPLLQQLFPFAQFADPQLEALKLVRGADKILTSRNSTVILDAIANRKMTILLDLPGNDLCAYKRGYFKEFAIESSDRSKLMQNITTSFSVDENNYVKRASKYIYLENASQRIANLIQQEV